MSVRRELLGVAAYLVAVMAIVGSRCRAGDRTDGRPNPEPVMAAMSIEPETAHLPQLATSAKLRRLVTPDSHRRPHRRPLRLGSATSHCDR